MMDDWSEGGLACDVRSWLFAAARTEPAFALATIVATDGGPRPVSTQMVVTRDEQHGFLSGGCIEADVARHARKIIEDRQPRRLVYGRGSPFMDLALPCGRRLDVLVERVQRDDPALQDLERLSALRRPALWRGDGHERACRPADDIRVEQATPWEAQVLFEPGQRLVVVGFDPFALAIAGMGLRLGWEVTLVGSSNSCNSPPPALRVMSGRPAQAIAAYRPDRWTAVAVATHDTDADVEALAPALPSDAGYVGAKGSRSRLHERRECLQAAGLDEAAIARLRAPIGLTIGGQSQWEVALSVTSEFVAAARPGLCRRHFL